MALVLSTEEPTNIRSYSIFKAYPWMTNIVLQEGTLVEYVKKWFNQCQMMESEEAHLYGVKFFFSN